MEVTGVKIRSNQPLPLVNELKRGLAFFHFYFHVMKNKNKVMYS